MPFVLRTTSTPPLATITELEQIVVIDQTGPAIPVGVSIGATGLVAEFLKGPFVPTEVFSSGDLISLYGGVSKLLSQTFAGVQDGSGGAFQGNGMLWLKSKSFRRLVIQRVDCDMTTTDGGTTKAFVNFSVTIATTDQDPDTATITGKDILIPAGTRFADDVLASATVIVALSQDIVIPKGTTITANAVAITANTVNANGTSGATSFFTLGTTAAIGVIDSVIDSVLPNVNSTIAASGISTVNSANSASAIFAAGTASATLAVKITAQYAAAIDKTRPGSDQTDDIVTICSARQNSTIRPLMATNATNSSEQGRGRIAIMAADPATASTTAAANTAKTNAKALATTEGYRLDRAIVSFPSVQIFSTEMGSINITVPSDSFMACTLANFPNEKNPGAANDFIQSIQKLEDAFVINPLSRGDYVSFKSNGVAALKKDRAVGWWYQSGITAVLPAVSPTRAPIKRRRMADEIQDTLVSIGANYNKEPATTERVDQLVAEIDAYLSGLLSTVNPSQQRIEAYSIDPVSGNTPALTALGIYTVKVAVRLLASMDDLVFNTTIGETVDPSSLAP